MSVRIECEIPARTTSIMTIEHDSSDAARSRARLARALQCLDALVNWERRDRDASMRRGLEPIQDILERMGDPERRWRAVHVAGTKGKGTTSALIASALGRGGLRVGLYTSPHVSRIHERIRVDGREVGDAVLASALERTLDARQRALDLRSAGVDATWFDLMTAAAFLVFAEAGVEWGVVECGLGGRLDSTNVIDGEVCVVTNIDLEHTAVLGNTRAAIAREKAGILKAGSTLVTSLPPVAVRSRSETAAGLAHSAARDEISPSSPLDEAGRVIQEAADRFGARVLRPDRIAPTMLERNADLARLVLDELGRRGVKSRDGKTFSGSMLDPAAISAARLPARTEKLWAGTTPVVLDAAHVASSVKMVLDELALDPELAGRAVAVLALGRDKDAAAILKTLVGRVDRLVCTTVASGPLAAAENLAKEAAREGIEAETASDPSRAFARALDLAQPEGWVLVIGSFYLAGALRSTLHPEPSAG
jgi:dihydrofolate synthase/folylpolyglutamate synthase